MLVTVTAQMRSEMREALRAVASANLSSMSSEIRRAIDEYIRRHGREWRRGDKSPALDESSGES